MQGSSPAPAPPGAAPQPCQTCGTTSSRTFTCIQCNSLAFCADCWPKWVLHAPGAVGWGGKPHEMSDPAVVQRLQRILTPPRSEADHMAELIEDEETTWFGFGRNSAAEPVFHDYGRFEAILKEGNTGEFDKRFPQLVSCVGETGAGKSTLIKLLIDRQDTSTQAASSRYCSPVSSSENDRLPTTGGVHIYPDPGSFFTEAPLLFADCEGLNGGEALPKGLRHHLQEMKSSGGLAQQSQVDRKRSQRPRHAAKRSIAWANSPQTRKREYAVAQLYPRILYTFSDVVVFVLRNPRSFESTVLGRLLHWAAASVDKSLNQPVLPHAVLVLNATSDNVDPREWDPAEATRLLMAEVKDAVKREPALEPYVMSWRRRGRLVRSTEELLACYYASVTVVRIPTLGPSYMALDRQLSRLESVVRARAAESHARKRQVRMLASGDRLHVYLQAAYDHFTRDLDSPFDFVAEALRNSQVPRDFYGNILSLAIQVKEKAANPALRDDARELFRRLGPMVASCVMFDAVRQNLLGSAARIFEDAYAEPCAAALETFADMHWPCSFRNANMPLETGRCCNVKSGHSPKGHQNAQGKIIGSGGYQRSTTFEAAEFAPEWAGLVRDNLLQLLTTAYELGQKLPGRSELHVAAILHRERVNDFFRITGNVLSFVSHSACFSCLRGLPECALPCGHVLCLPCVKTYGIITSQTTLELSRCPLHVREIMANPPWVITIKPKHAGTRILSLDGGGGIRGIVQLHTLRAIEEVLGPNLPLQMFFDLIVGTSTGGVLAIILGVKRWPISLTIRKFRAMIREYFVPREMSSVPLLGGLSSLYHGSIYKTRPIETSLKINFPDQPFFGGSRSHEMPVKVAVTATTLVQYDAVVFANYNRPDPKDKELPYHFERSDIPAKEMKVWEAARATSATPPFWKPHQKAGTTTQYIDGGLYHRNPVRVAHHEARTIWTDVADTPPDILLSIGSGLSVHDRNPQPQARNGGSSSQPLTSVESASIYSANSSYTSTAAQRNRSSLISSLPGGTKLEDHRHCDVMWARFLSELEELSPPPKGTATASTPAMSSTGSSILHDYDNIEDLENRYIRLTPELQMPIPKFDDFSKLEELEHETEETLSPRSGSAASAAVREVAHRLVASCFYFEKDVGSVRKVQTGAVSGTTPSSNSIKTNGSADPLHQKPSGSKSSYYVCTGSIHCRFRAASAELKALGEFMRSRCTKEFSPYFLIEEEVDDESEGNGHTRQNSSIASSIPLSSGRFSSSTSSSTPATDNVPPMPQGSRPGTKHRFLRVNTRSIPISDSVRQDMCWEGLFELPPIQITSARERSATRITLCLQPGGDYSPERPGSPRPSSPSTHHTQGSTERGLPISGFPRRLMKEDLVASSKKGVVPAQPLTNNRSTLISSSRAERTYHELPGDSVQPAPAAAPVGAAAGSNDVAAPTSDPKAGSSAPSTDETAAPASPSIIDSPTTPVATSASCSEVMSPISALSPTISETAEQRVADLIGQKRAATTAAAEVGSEEDGSPAAAASSNDGAAAAASQLDIHPALRTSTLSDAQLSELALKKLSLGPEFDVDFSFPTGP